MSAPPPRPAPPPARPPPPKTTPAPDSATTAANVDSAAATAAPPTDSSAGGAEAAVGRPPRSLVYSLTTSIPDAEKDVVDPRFEDKTTFYVVEVTCDGSYGDGEETAWQTRKRYGDFEELHKTLRHVLPNLAFPPPALFYDTDKRRLMLADYLAGVVAQAALLNPALVDVLLDFLDVPSELCVSVGDGGEDEAGEASSDAASDATAGNFALPHLLDSQMPVQLLSAVGFAEALRFKLEEHEATASPDLVQRLERFASGPTPSGTLFLNEKPRDWQRFEDDEFGRQDFTGMLTGHYGLLTQSFRKLYFVLDDLDLCFFASKEDAEPLQRLPEAGAGAAAPETAAAAPAKGAGGFFGRALAATKELAEKAKAETSRLADKTVDLIQQRRNDKQIGEGNSGQRKFAKQLGSVNLGLLCDVRLSNHPDKHTQAALDLVMVDNVLTLCAESSLDHDPQDASAQLLLTEKDNMLGWARALLDRLDRAAEWRRTKGAEQAVKVRSKSKRLLRSIANARKIAGRAGEASAAGCIKLVMTMCDTSAFHSVVCKGNLQDIQSFAAEENKRTGKFLPPQDIWGTPEARTWGIFATDRMWNSALHYAVFCRKSTDILDWLLRVGFDVNSYSCIVTPLHVAAINSDVQTTEWLLRHGARPDLRSRRCLFPVPLCVVEWQPESFAAISAGTNKKAVIDLLVQAKVNPRAFSSSYDVFISYRVSSDAAEAEQLRLAIMHAGKLGSNPAAVYLDKVELEAGKQWDAGFAHALTQSNIFCPLISTGNLSKMVPLMQADEADWCDNVLLEFELALTLMASNKIKGIHPIFVGSQDARGYLELAQLDEVIERLSERPSKTTKQAMVQHLQSVNLSGVVRMVDLSRSVRDTVKAICQYPGFGLHAAGLPEAAHTAAIQEIRSCVNVHLKSLKPSAAEEEFLQASRTGATPAPAADEASAADASGADASAHAPLKRTTSRSSSVSLKRRRAPAVHWCDVVFSRIAETGASEKATHPASNATEAPAPASSPAQERCAELTSLLEKLAAQAAAENERNEAASYQHLAAEVKRTLRTMSAVEVGSDEELLALLQGELEGMQPQIGFAAEAVADKYQVFVPIVSANTIAHLGSEAALQAEVSQLLVDWDVALELATETRSNRFARLLKILPVLVGERDARAYFSFFELNHGRPAVQMVPNIIAKPSKAAAEELIRKHNIEPSEDFFARTVQDIVRQVLTYQGFDLRKPSLRSYALQAAGHFVFDKAEDIFNAPLKDIKKPTFTAKGKEREEAKALAASGSTSA